MIAAGKYLLIAIYQNHYIIEIVVDTIDSQYVIVFTIRDIDVVFKNKINCIKM